MTKSQRITPECQPVFPCWLGRLVTPAVIVPWQYFIAKPVDFILNCATHWSDSPADCQPDASQEVPDAVCPSCNGKGEWTAHTGAEPCLHCGQTGRVQSDPASPAPSKETIAREAIIGTGFYRDAAPGTFGRNEWLDLLMACQDGRATCMRTLEIIEREMDLVGKAPPEVVIDEMTNAFLRWPLPESVCADLCATKQGPGRIGTNLLSFMEAKQMFTEIVGPLIVELEAECSRLKAREVVLSDRQTHIHFALEKAGVPDHEGENETYRSFSLVERIEKLHERLRALDRAGETKGADVFPDQRNMTPEEKKFTHDFFMAQFSAPRPPASVDAGTPRTDAETMEHTCEDGWHCIEMYKGGTYVKADFARTLEREVIQLTEVDFKNAALIDKLQEERDFAQGEVIVKGASIAVLRDKNTALTAQLSSLAEQLEEAKTGCETVSLYHANAARLLGIAFLGMDHATINAAIEKEVLALRSALAEKEKESAELAAWKESAMAVENEWDAQAVGKLLGIPLGGSIRKGIEPAIRSLRSALAFYANAANYRRTGWQGDQDPSAVEKDNGALARVAIT